MKRQPTEFATATNDNGDFRLTGEESLSITNDGQDDGHDDSGKPSIARYETRLVNFSRILFIAGIFIVAIAVGCVTYFVARAGEEEEYIDHFHTVSNEIIQVCQTRARQIFDNIEGLSAFFTSHVMATNETWPFVVIPDFEVHAQVSSQITGAATLTIHPLVTHSDRPKWEQFSQATYEQWMQESNDYDRTVHPELYLDTRKMDVTRSANKESQRWNVTGIIPRIWTDPDKDGKGAIAPPADQYFPEWQRAPAPDYSPFTIMDMGSHPEFGRTIQGMLETDHPVLTVVTDASFLIDKYDRRFPAEEQKEPHSYLLQPLYDDLNLNRTAIGFLSAFLRWGTFFENVLPEHERGVMIVLFGTCGRKFSYILNGYDAVFIGKGDLHDSEYDELSVDFEIVPFAKLEDTIGEQKHCQYSARIYPSDAWKERFYTQQPLQYAAAVTCCFIITAILFVIYDWLVQNRQKKVLDTAERSTAIVSNLFPSGVRETLMKEAIQEDSQSRHLARGKTSGALSTSETIFGSSPIAELFPESTIMFADIAGFTAWCSGREPKDVFLLLETIYHSFDTIAKRRRVFKVETIGDCYVAVCGVPTKNDLHALVMSKFAIDCLNKMGKLVQELEACLGPGTESLALRVGLHSGPVTAGVLRGDRGRFQLFGDTMNTASRMESTGVKNKIQISQATADLLAKANKNWTVPREEKVVAKGKGSLQTYWLKVPSKLELDSTSRSDNTLGSNETRTTSLFRDPKAESSDSIPSSSTVDRGLPDNICRLVQWNVDILQVRLKQIIAVRPAVKSKRSESAFKCDFELSDHCKPFDEIQETLDFPCSRVDTATNDDRATVLPSQVFQQLHDYMTEIALAYNDNAFHSFQHASHVTMSITKLQAHIAQSTDESTIAKLVSQPLAQFSIILAGLIHNVSHTGLSNSILIRDKHPIALKYGGKSVAEQNSFSVAWNLLMKQKYADLRDCIFIDKAEMLQFRSLLIRLVAATDITDKDLSATREALWELAYGGDASTSSLDCSDKAKLKATVVLETLIQVSDISHTMQHWHIFYHWNECSFREMYKAFLNGKLDKNPSLTWFEAELEFYDRVVIPLATRMESCGVFGVSGVEYLNNAKSNRSEWAEKGEGLVQEYLKAFASSKSG